MYEIGIKKVVEKLVGERQKGMRDKKEIDRGTYLRFVFPKVCKAKSRLHI